VEFHLKKGCNIKRILKGQNVGTNEGEGNGERERGRETKRHIKRESDGKKCNSFETNERKLIMKMEEKRKIC
jgi:hypothetical protein